MINTSINMTLDELYKEVKAICVDTFKQVLKPLEDNIVSIKNACNTSSLSYEDTVFILNYLKSTNEERVLLRKSARPSTQDNIFHFDTFIVNGVNLLECKSRYIYDNLKGVKIVCIKQRSFSECIEELRISGNLKFTDDNALRRSLLEELQSPSKNDKRTVKKVLGEVQVHSDDQNNPFIRACFQRGLGIDKRPPDIKGKKKKEEGI